jgi:hypothetical protein
MYLIYKLKNVHVYGILALIWFNLTINFMFDNGAKK